MKKADLQPITKNMNNPIRKIYLKHIHLDTRLQPRDGIDEKHVTSLIEAIQNGAVLPPATVFVLGGNNSLAGGWHRYEAHERLGLKHLKCEVREGTFDDAWLFSRGDNNHGKRLNNEEKNRSVREMLEKPEIFAWSDRAIAAHVGSGAPLVGKIRKDLTVIGLQSNERMGRDGRVINTANIGQKTNDEAPVLTPEEEAELESYSEELRAEEEAKNEPPFEPIDEDVDPFENEPEPAPNEPEFVVDTLSAVQGARENEAQNSVTDTEGLDDARWLLSLPAYRYLQTTGNRGLFFKRAALDYRLGEKALDAYRKTINAGQSLKMADGSPYSKVISPLMSLKHPRFWRICGGCKGGGCARCNSTGYDLAAGLDASVLLNEMEAK